ncbi:MAG TPA: alpha-amylase family glycosyl hydrolase [Polyangia bacterium]|nr:alpha-amylase family glycosyl hydrolase [Polyangia bacterium]
MVDLRGVGDGRDRLGVWSGAAARDEAPIVVTTAPSPRKDVMGPFLHDGGCTFRVWSLFAAQIDLKLFGANAPPPIAMARDSADGYGNDVWSVFVPGVVEETAYRYLVTFSGGDSAERVDPFARSIVFPNFTPANQDDGDARSMVTDRAFNFGAPFQAPGWRELVIYQLHVGTFFDARCGATPPIDALINQIPYLSDLGVNAVQFLPFVEFSGALSLGYDPVLPFALERDYGMPQDFKRLVKALHDAGISVLVDLVYNHLDVSAGGGPALAYSLFQYDGFGGDPCGIFFYGGDEMNTPFGGPRPNYGRDAVCRFLSDNTMMWLDEYQVDGVRFDSTGCIRKRQGPCGDHCCGGDIGVGRNLGWELMQRINDRIDAGSPWKLSIAEDLDGNGAITAPTNRGGAGFDAQWDMDLQGALIAAITQPTDSAVNLSPVADRLQHAVEGDLFKRIIYLESHDQAKNGRVPDLVFPGDSEGWFARKKSMLGFGVVLTAPGVPMFFQGAEILDTRRWAPDGNAPTKMDFTRRQTFSRLFQFYGDMSRLRRSAAGLAGAGINVFVANPETKVMAYHRWNQGSGTDDLVVVANFSSTPFPSYTIGFPLAGNWFVRLNSDANVYSDANDFGSVNTFDTTAGPGGYDGMPFSGNVGIGPFSLVVLGR